MRKSNYTGLLAAAVVGALCGTRAMAAFNYDLRLSSATANGATSVHTVPVPVIGATYTLQLWAQITGNDIVTFNDGFNGASGDGWVDGVLGIQSTTVGSTGAFSAGGITTGVFSGSTTSPLRANAQVGLPLSNPVTGLTDWGNNTTTTGDLWMIWNTNSPGYSPGADIIGSNTPVGEPVGSSSNGWELQIATFKVVGTAGGGGETVYNTLFPAGAGTLKTGTQTVFGLEYYQNDPGLAAGNNPTTAPIFVGETATGVTFGSPSVITTPEPASLGMLGLGVLALISRRRKA